MFTGHDIHDLIRKWESPLLQYAIRFLHDRTQADSAVREAFLRLIRMKKKRMVCASVLLFRLVRDICGERLRAGGETDAAFRLGPEESGNPLAGAIRTLPGIQQELLVLRYECAMSFQSVSEITGLAPDTVAKTILDAEESLKNHH